MLHQIAIVSSVIVGSTMYLVVSEARRIRALFYVDPNDCITFEELQDIFPQTADPIPPLRSASPSNSPALARAASGSSRLRTNVD